MEPGIFHKSWKLNTIFSTKKSAFVMESVGFLVKKMAFSKTTNVTLPNFNCVIVADFRARKCSYCTQSKFRKVLQFLHGQR